MGTERKIVSLACPVCGNEMIHDGKIRMKCDICGAVRGQALQDYSLFDPAPISKEVLGKAIPPIDIHEVSELQESELKMPENIEFCFSDYKQKMLTCVEMEDEFIFEHLVKYAHDELYTPEDDIRISKKLLVRALTCFRAEHKEEWDLLMKNEETKNE